MKALLSFLVLMVSLCRADDPKITPEKATKEHPFVNSLGMKFVPVPITGGPTDSKTSKKIVLFCIHDTRKGDYRKYAEANAGVDQS